MTSALKLRKSRIACNSSDGSAWARASIAAPALLAPASAEMVPWSIVIKLGAQCLAQFKQAREFVAVVAHLQRQAHRHQVQHADDDL